MNNKIEIYLELMTKKGFFYGIISYLDSDTITLFNEEFGEVDIDRADIIEIVED